MAALSVFPSGTGAGGGATGATLSSGEYVLVGSFDPTSSSQILIGTLPANARVIDVVSLGGATGGTNPTVDIGTSDDDGLANELDADGVSSALAAGTTGAQFGTVISATSTTAVYGKVGASAATGGTVTVAIRYVFG
jgi:hypothetical protein